MTDRVDEVIRDVTLRGMARERWAAKASVLIEISVPTTARPVPFGQQRPPTSGQPATVTLAVAPESDSAPPPEAARAVTEVLGHTPLYLRAAHAFVSDATGAQLAALAASPFVHAIRPSKRVYQR